MNEEIRFAHTIRHVLHQGTDALDAKVATRLHIARTAALGSQRQPVARLSLAGIGNIASDLIHTNLAPTVLAFALLIGAAGTVYFNDMQQVKENVAIDSALLTDDLPINAYLDAGFQEWVATSSPASD